MESKHRQTKPPATLAGDQPSRALAVSHAHNRRVAAAQLAAPALRRWRRAGRYGIAG